MLLNPDTIGAAARRIGITPGDLTVVLQQGDAVTYNAGDYLFHESTPRQWFGIVLEGEVETLRGAQARSVVLATHTAGALLGEGTMLGESTHWASAVTHKGASVWQISRAALEQVRRDKPEVFYHIVGR